ncbi:hypothetical protein MELE44368_22565 [Mycolicibacterium elephantis DSM 44368]|uniref:Uncharacterized protein n=1 Tax=Mycolicibacterium elephantis DSM 44368 TaxID=1335622 RepID=A0A439DS81_9MYCO|nr:hypothetical protein MELE44368_22565 [Mycolicibacterium elephantis DSM 44368]
MTTIADLMERVPTAIAEATDRARTFVGGDRK